MQINLSVGRSIQSFDWYCICIIRKGEDWIFKNPEIIYDLTVLAGMILISSWSEVDLLIFTRQRHNRDLMYVPRGRKRWYAQLAFPPPPVFKRNAAGCTLLSVSHPEHFELGSYMDFSSLLETSVWKPSENEGGGGRNSQLGQYLLYQRSHWNLVAGLGRGVEKDCTPTPLISPACKEQQSAAENPHFS